MAKSDTSDPNTDARKPRGDEEVAVAMAPIAPAAQRAADPAPQAGRASDGAARTPDEGRTPMPPPADAPARRSSGPSFMALLLGGLLAGAIGYLVSQYVGFDSGDDAMNQRMAAQDERIEGIATQLDAPDESATAIEEIRRTFSRMDGEISDLRDRVAAVEEGAAETGPGQEVAARIEDNSGQVDDLRAQVENLAEQVESGPSDTVETLQARVEELAAQLSRQDGAIAEARDAAVAEARSAATVGAIAEIRAAIIAGAPFPDALGTLQDGGVDVPAPLPDVASEGVATLSGLQERFADASRAALDASLSETAGDGTLDRLGAFLAAQTGARSLDEREGAGADAVLSRAEARVRDGDLEAALSEIEALPQSGQAAMSDWTDAARTRVEAISSAARLAQSTNNN